MQLYYYWLEFSFPDKNNQLLEMKPVGAVFLLEPAGKVLFLANESTVTLWSNGLPHDVTPREIKNYSLLQVVIICYTYATAGICFALVCLIFNIVFRKRK